MRTSLAEAADARLSVVLRSAEPRTLHGDESWRTDGNCPAIADRSGVTVFFSIYEPRARTFRRRHDHALHFEAKAQPVRLLADPDPQSQKWIEAVWRSPRGRLYGWYHAEEIAPCPTRLDVPHIGEAFSDDDGLTWHCRGALLRAPKEQLDCSQRNGFVAGGYGDLCVVPDRAGRHLYVLFSSYVAEESAQGVVMARMPADREREPREGLELWSSHGWQPACDRLPKPLWRPARSWRHADPDAFWGPAVHYHRALGAYVMLLNHTSGGDADFVQEGVYVSMSRTLDDPPSWTTPLQIVRGGAWYPQVIGLEEGCGNAEVAVRARFFMSGFSAWEIEFAAARNGHPINQPLHLTKPDFARLFGAGRRSPW